MNETEGGGEVWSLWGRRWCCTCGFNSQHTPSPGPVTGCYEGVHPSPECFGGSFCWKIWKQQALRHLVSKPCFLLLNILNFVLTRLWWFQVNSRGTQPYIFVVVQASSRVLLFAIPWTAPRQAPLSSTTCIHSPQTSLPSRLPRNIEQSSLSYTVGPCWLSI